MISDHCALVQFKIFLSQLKDSVSISISLTFQTLFSTSFMNNWYKLMQTSSLMMFHCQIVLSLPTPQESMFFLLWSLFIMPQATCLAQGGCFVNVFKPLTLGSMVLQDMIVFSFNMILMHYVSVGCTLHGYTIFFPFITAGPTFHMCWFPGI